MNQELQVSIHYRDDDDNDDKEGSWINDGGKGSMCVYYVCVTVTVMVTDSPSTSLHSYFELNSFNIRERKTTKC